MGTPAAPISKTLPALYYTDAERFRREMEKFYFQSWVCAGRAEQAAEPGDYFLREVGGESIIITRDAAECCARSTTCAGIAARECARLPRVRCPGAFNVLTTVGAMGWMAA